MMIKRRYFLLLFSIASIVSPLSAGAENGRHDLFFDASVVDMSKVSAWLRENPGVVERVFPLVFNGAQRAFRAQPKEKEPTLFKPAKPYRKSSGDPFGTFLEETAGLEIEIYPTFDLFHWTLPLTAPEDDLFTMKPGLFERDAKHTCGKVKANGRYASPFSPEARKALVELLTKFIESYGGRVRGIGLRAELSFGPFLGYSIAARVASIRALQLDPIDLSLRDPDKYTEEWAQWRLDSITQLIAEIAKSVKGKSPNARIISFAEVNAYKWKLINRSKIGQDWLKWATDGLIDDIVFTTDWLKPYNADSLKLAQSLLAKANKSFTAKPIVKITEEAGSLREQVENIRKNNEVPSMVISLAREDDLSVLIDIMEGLRP